MDAAGGGAARALVLIADDDVELTTEISDFLVRYEFRCLTAETWDDAILMVRREHPDAIILDQWLGDVDTLPLLPRLREMSDAPVVILTSNQEISDRIVGLEMGADDFLCKPVSGRELVARVRAHLRGRQRSPVSDGPSRPAWVVDPQTQRLRRPDGETIHLTTAEFTLLARLMDAPGVVCSRDELTRAVFNRPWRGGDRAVDSIIVNLRLKLDRAGGAPAASGDSCILTVRNAGYKFVKFPE